mmetsp:Transcript_3633/g.6735  ORF Transcript_3633/g.6735 Transcript_3633/m.6735 type:complete len:111 (-) Transcript_3633:56-388(-)
MSAEQEEIDRYRTARNNERNDQQCQRRRMSAEQEEYERYRTDLINARSNQRNDQRRQRRRITRGHDAQERIQYLNIAGKTDIDTLQATDLPSVYKLSEDYTADEVCVKRH